MASILRRLRKDLRMQKRLRDNPPGGNPPKRATADAEGMLLSRALERAAKENGAADPLHFLDYLRKMRRGYDRAVDGPSKLMALVDAINKFEKEELARRNGPKTTSGD